VTDVTRLLEAANRGDRQAAAELLPLVYDELRKLAAAKMAHEKPGHTLDATALVHEAYLRLVGEPRGSSPRDNPDHGDKPRGSPAFDGRGHFFAAAAEAMRRILVDSARRKSRAKHGGAARRVDMPNDLPAPAAPIDDVLAVDEALDRLAARDAAAAELVKLHYFAGFTLEAAADVLGIPHRTAYRDWAFARAWLAQALGGNVP
jgi:RNA polymerase sigma factor (sigma-70 family)